MRSYTEVHCLFYSAYCPKNEAETAWNHTVSRNRCRLSWWTWSSKYTNDTYCEKITYNHSPAHVRPYHHLPSRDAKGECSPKHHCRQLWPQELLHGVGILPPSWSSCDAKATSSHLVVEASGYRDDGAAVSVMESESRTTQTLHGGAEANENG